MRVAISSYLRVNVMITIVVVRMVETVVLMLHILQLSGVRDAPLDSHGEVWMLGSGFFCVFLTNKGRFFFLRRRRLQILFFYVFF